MKLRYNKKWLWCDLDIYTMYHVLFFMHEVQKFMPLPLPQAVGPSTLSVPETEQLATPVRFVLTRGNPNGLAIHRNQGPASPDFGMGTLHGHSQEERRRRQDHVRPDQAQQVRHSRTVSSPSDQGPFHEHSWIHPAFKTGPPEGLLSGAFAS